MHLRLSAAAVRLRCGCVRLRVSAVRLRADACGCVRMWLLWKGLYVAQSYAPLRRVSIVTRASYATARVHRSKERR